LGILYIDTRDLSLLAIDIPVKNGHVEGNPGIGPIVEIEKGESDGIAGPAVIVTGTGQQGGVSERGRFLFDILVDGDLLVCRHYVRVGLLYPF